ncbi:MAG: hypothetical protein K8S97_14925 [Anaerolineae bacterium]|nr:hypothetical protein [Anaerolineae bacterium]
MDWLKQSEEMIKMWTDTQQQMVNKWLEQMQQFTQPQASGVWEKTLETWENAVNNMLETQGQWARMWAGTVTATKGIPKETAEGAVQFKDMTERWVTFQRDLWQGWFETVRKLNPTEAAQGDPQQIFAAWQDSFQQVMQTQMDWVRQWTGAQQDK